MGPVGAILGSLGAILGPFGAILEPLGAILGPSWALWGPSWSLLGPRVHGLFEKLPARHELAVQLIADTRNHQTLHCGTHIRQGVLAEFEVFTL